MRGNPVAWRERCVNGIAPLAWMRLMPRWPAVIAVFVVSAGGFALLALRALPPGVNPWTVVETHGPIGLFAEIRQLDSSMKVACVAYHGAIALLLQVLLVATRASGCVTEERENGTWDGLLLTPISTKQIVGGKFWGIVRALLPYMAANALAILAVTAPLGGFAIVWGICSVIVSFVAVGWTAAMGIYWSSHLQSTWRSLLVTLTACFITANALALLSAILGGFLGFVVGFVVILEVALGGPPVDDAVVFATSCLVPTAIAWAGFCWLIGRETLLQGAVARINTVDRTRVARGFTRDYINWRLDRSEERRRDKIAKQTADPVQIVDDES